MRTIEPVQFLDAPWMRLDRNDFRVEFQKGVGEVASICANIEHDSTFRDEWPIETN
jgi:hypothetical protein